MDCGSLVQNVCLVPICTKAITEFTNRHIHHVYVMQMPSFILIKLRQF